MANGRTRQEEDKVQDQRQDQMVSLLQEIANNTRQGLAVSGGAGAVGGQGTGTALAGGKTRRIGQSSPGPDIGAVAGGPAGLIASQIAGGVDKTLVKPTKSVFAQSIGQTFRDQVRFGGDTGGFRSNFNRNAANLPFVGGLVSDVVDPKARAAQRTNALVSLISRGGGAVSDEGIQDFYQRNLAEEERAQAASKRVERITKQDLGSNESNQRVDEAIGRGVDRIIDAMTNLFSGG